MNFKMRDDVVREITEKTTQLMTRRVDYARGAFPLTLDEIRHAVMTDEQLELADRLQATGFTQFRESTTVSFYAGHEDYPVGLKRAAAVHLALPESILQPRTVFLQFRNSKRLPNEPDHEAVTELYRLRLGDAQRLAVAEWVARVIRETRLQDMVGWAVTYALKHCPSTGHLLALWPLLATFAESPFWRARFRDPPRKLADYAPDMRVVERVGRAIGVADPLLQGAEMLEPWSKPADTIGATLVAWEWLDNDRAYE